METCTNCRNKSEFVAEIDGVKYYRCAENADVLHNGVLQIVSDAGRCEDNFEPSDAYEAELASELADTAAYNRAPAGYYGLTAGVDFPATLNRGF